MAPWIPRLHLFEIDDQPWFPPFLRARVQDGLMHAWTFCLPPLQSCSPATLVANLLQRNLGPAVSNYTYIDFCAGAGGPTPFIERALNRYLKSSTTQNGAASNESNGAKSYAAVIANGSSAVDFVLTDLHPHVESWERAAKKSAYITYEAESVDAANAPPELVGRYKDKGQKVFRLFNLAFHHFDDGLARAILKNTVETSDGFGIFELQDRSISSFISCCLFGVFILLFAPIFYWWSPSRLFFTYLMPIIPFVLVFDGIISCLRTRTAEEVEIILRTCGTNTDGWEIKSGREQFLWPTGYLTWIICTKKQ
ncbi:uncharacterized protein BCR38DRAFT_449536 [Pseudomassariella vexata]|uniref:Uncharacterized protein n=1 Tax=Pseudomassariella vexata TaxID=1141098 RepID=A0A1Y2DEE8_9PEZI|nr:uncharacterized protein BCR38DRAFT_449536 [Pseudomassariella vexata]ORY57577.1 hypothetical protein BCR38DRAFT_449536 [Pseudomassariella vexata]